MILQKTGFAGVAFACAVLLGSTLSVQARAQTTTTDQTTTTTTETQSHDAWQAPRGYDQAYPESVTPNMVARQGEADASRGKKFKPTEADSYGHAKIPKGMDKDEFKLQFRESFVKGYTSG